MPWNQANVKTFDALRDPKLSREIFRSGCYERAIAALQSTADLNTKTATVASLHELLKAAGVDDPQAAAGQQHDRQPKTQQEVLVAKTIRQEREKAKADKAQLRRERQQQRHEDSMALRQQRHEKKVKIRREEFTAELLQGEEQRDKMLAHLKEQQHSLQQQLAVQQEVLFQLPSPHTSVDNDQALKTLHQQLQCLQKQKEQAEEQLELACKTSQEMFRRAASIEPEDGECTPSPVAADHPFKGELLETLGQVPTQPMEMLPKDVSNGAQAVENLARRSLHSARQDSMALPPPPPLPS